MNFLKKIKKMDNIFYFVIFYSILIYSIVLHEIGHGLAALLLGDKTALKMGRLSLNPIKHADLVGTIILPLLIIISGSSQLFGYAKPVPVNFNGLKHPRRDTIIVAIAGPVVNIIIALMLSTVLNIDFENQEITRAIIQGMYLNFVLAFFNMTPLLPLDGGRILAEIMPKEIGNQFKLTEKYGFIEISILVFSPIGNKLFSIIGQISKNIISILLEGF